MYNALYKHLTLLLFIIIINVKKRGTWYDVGWGEGGGVGGRTDACVG